MDTQTQSKGELNKKTDHAFKKDIYLLGTDNNGTKYWLEAPSWDCSWYWGFGFVETYTNNSSPSKSKDISSHSHIDSAFKRNDKISLWNTQLVKHTYTGAEAKQLNELFTQFYSLKDKAAKIHDNEWNKSSIDELKKT